MKVVFTELAWKEYMQWQSQDKKTHKRINKLIKDSQRTPFQGIGKPEPLKYEFSGYWSRRINETDRLVYKVEEENIYVIQCKQHY